MLLNYIPFMSQFIPAIRLGVKTMTCRTRKYGEPGDTLAGPQGIRIQLLETRRTRLGDVAEHHFMDEGCGSPQDFIRVWEGLHPTAGYDPDRIVWLHVFRYAPEATS